MPTESEMLSPILRTRAERRHSQRPHPIASYHTKKLRAARKVERQNRKRGRGR